MKLDATQSRHHEIGTIASRIDLRHEVEQFFLGYIVDEAVVTDRRAQLGSCRLQTDFDPTTKLRPRDRNAGGFGGTTQKLDPNGHAAEHASHRIYSVATCRKHVDEHARSGFALAKNGRAARIPSKPKTGGDVSDSLPTQPLADRIIPQPLDHRESHSSPRGHEVVAGFGLTPTRAPTIWERCRLYSSACQKLRKTP